MKKTIYLMSGLLIAGLLGGCYVYTDEPPPAAVIIMPVGTSAPAPAKAEPEAPPAPSGAPSGAVGPPQ